MARVSGRNTAILILDSNSASRQISGRANSGTLTFTSEEVDVTSFGALYRERIADALRDWSVEISGFYDGSASQIDEILHGVLAACTSLCFGPSGSGSGEIQYSGCAILQEYSMESAVDGAVTFSATFQSASVLNRGTWA
jgi:predicted secreted protein